MKSILLSSILSILLLLITKKSNAQFKYDVSSFNRPYIVLTDKDSLISKDLEIWDDFNFKIPFGFPFELNGVKTNNFCISYSNIISTDTTYPYTGFMPMFTDIIDRGYVDFIKSESPIYYHVEGIPGSRIFKVQYTNCGSFLEYDELGTLNDFVNYQVWLYEKSNIIDFHFGSSSFTSGVDFLINKVKGPFYLKNWDIFNTGEIDKAFYLIGNTYSPKIDSSLSFLFSDTLTEYPKANTVIRFTPKSPSNILNISNNTQNIKIYPTLAKHEVNIQTPDIYKSCSYTLFSENGARLGIEGKTNGIITTVDISNLSSGNYYVVILSENGIISTHRFTKCN